MQVTEIKNKLRECQPYHIEHNLIPKLYFKEDKNNCYYWIFFYAYVRQLNETSIGVRVGYERHTISRKLSFIIKSNISLIKEFLNIFVPKI